MAEENSLAQMLQVIVVAFVGVLVVIIIGVFQLNSFLSAAEFLANIAQTGAGQVEALVTSAISQASLIIQSAELTAEQILGDVINAIYTGVQLVFGAGLAIGTSILDSIRDGANAIIDLLIELAQNITTAFINFMQPIQQTILMFGEVILDTISTVVATFSPIFAITKATQMLVCCVTKSIYNFPLVPAFSWPFNCPTGGMWNPEPNCDCFCPTPSLDCSCKSPF